MVTSGPEETNYATLADIILERARTNGIMKTAIFALANEMNFPKQITL